jgi:glycosyltransferase involved in cell wall biosynthesis
MKICIWFQITSGPWGGANQFLGRLSKELVRQGHAVVSNPNDRADVVLVNAFLRGPGRRLRPGLLSQLRHQGRIWEWSKASPAGLWSWLPRKGPPIVHRLDGVADLYRGTRTRDDDIQASLNRFADYTVFQSKHCLVTFNQIGVCPANYDLIINGVDGDVFFPGDRRRLSGDPLRLIAVSWSSNPRKGFDLLARISRCSGVEVYFIGNWCESIPPEKVRILGVKSPAEVAEILRTMDGMIHAGQHECCSNAILEALASGMPVLYLDSGGNRELAEEHGAALGDDSQRDVDDFRAKFEALREKVLADRERFLIAGVARRYLQAFEAARDLVAGRR